MPAGKLGKFYSISTAGSYVIHQWLAMLDINMRHVKYRNAIVTQLGHI